MIVAGHSGYGKSTIIKHIALEYRRQGWVVKLVTEVTEIICIFVKPIFREQDHFHTRRPNRQGVFRRNCHSFMENTRRAIENLFRESQTFAML